MTYTRVACAQKLADFTPQSWSALMQQHSGKPYVVHFWGMSCAPCITDLPQWKARQLALAPEEVILVQADLASIPAVERRLREAHLIPGTVQLFTVSEDMDERWRYDIDPNWSGELPFTLLIDGFGLIKELKGTNIDAELQRWKPK